jgi:hypothetical protein
MPPSLFADICSALGESVDVYLGRPSRGFIGEAAWLSVAGAHMQHNLSRVVVAGIAAHGRQERRRTNEFGHAALGLTEALVRLSMDPGPGALVQSYAAETAYLGVVGTMALPADKVGPDLIPELWTTVVRRLLDPTKEVSDEVEMLSALLLFGVSDAESTARQLPAFATR